MVTCFSEAEIAKGVVKLKPGKTSGISGISAELLQGLWALDEGKQMLSSFMNDLLMEAEHPADLHDSFVTLVPKIKNVTQPHQIRPINLVEVCHKLYCSLLLNRILRAWPQPPQQYGAVPGGQVMDALAAAGWRVLHESMTTDRGIWINTDIRSAFDSVSHLALSRYIRHNTPDYLAREGLQLLRAILHPRLLFQWRGWDWSLEQGQGVQQGHTFSAVVFAHVIGSVLHDVSQQWKALGYDTTIGEWGFLFVDDLLLRFDNWHTAAALVPLLQARLASIGLHFNVSKSQLMAHSEDLAVGRRMDLPPDHFLNNIAWVTCTKYLRKDLRFLEVGEDLCSVHFDFLARAVHCGVMEMRPVLKGLSWGCPRLAIQLTNRYIGSKWFRMSPLLTPTGANMDRVHVLQTTVLGTFLQLYIPAQCRHDLAMTLHRLRRRAVHLLLSFTSHQAWTCIWRLRCWTYYGHLLRKPPEHLTRKIFLGLVHAVRPQGGFPNTPLRWLRSAVSDAYGMLASIDQLCELAQNRRLWYETGRKWIQQSYAGPGVAHQTWSRWQHTVQQHVAWMFNAVLLQTESGLLLLWVDDTEGLVQLCHPCDASLERSLLHSLQHVRMQTSASVFTLTMRQEVYEAFLYQFRQVSLSLFHDFEIVFLIELLSDSMYQSVCRLLR